MNSYNWYMHSYYNKIVYLHIYTPTNVGNILDQNMYILSPFLF